LTEGRRAIYVFTVTSTALPLIRRLHLRDPLEALHALAHQPSPFLLQSSMEDERSRWSFFGADPFEVHRGNDYEKTVRRWRELSARTRAAEVTPTVVPFTGGAVGYWSYDFGRRLEALPSHAADDIALPDVLLGFYDVVGAYDHQSREGWLFSSGLPHEGETRVERAKERLDKFEWLLTSGVGSAVRTPEGGGGGETAVSGFQRDAYLRAIEQVQDHIRRGDIFQANLSQRWTLPLGFSTPAALGLALHEMLVRRSPAPFSAFLGAPDHAIVSASPERFLELRGSRVETRPIKGTRPRSGDFRKDAVLREELVSSAKDRAENVMIVDVLRNDLGRVCQTGSVETPSLCELEIYPQVFHLTSTVTGRLREGLDAFDLLHACFPGGSITGAPKIRAMEILESIEPVRRHIYTGSIGYLDWGGDADWNIAIRTALVTPHALHFAAGGGITADSEPEAEYEETLHKAEGMRLALEALFGPVTLGAAGVTAR
jgi:para-aminobenzoate synthetase component 1